MKHKRKINAQKIFCFVSLIFLLTCTFWYGGRLIFFYLQNNKSSTQTKEISFANNLMSGNNTLKKINNEYYFYKDAKNNYVTYSNITFRILKITKNNKVVLVSDEPITKLAYGTEVSYEKSPIIKWLNKSNNKNDGILETNLNSPDKYLDQTETCIDTIDDIKKLTCKEKNNNNISILTITDYLNVGSTKSFINNGFNIYLANNNKNNEKWTITDEGKLTTDDGSSILGIKIVITLKNNIKLSSGDGTQKNPYKFETDNNYFGSYIKLGEDLWRVYNEEEKIISLSLNDYLKLDNTTIKHIYSNNNSYHNDTIKGSLAYYLNTTYLNSLNYKNIIITNNYNNGYYNEQNDYDYETAINEKVDTKVSNLSIGNVLLNNELNNHFLSTGTYDKSEYIYLNQKNGTIETIKVNKEANIVPCISIEKSNLTKGTGTKNDPYRME